MTSFTRAEKVSGHIKKNLTTILKKSINDPRLEMVTITQVKLTNDLRIARVYFTLAGDQKTKKEAADGFKSAHGYLKRSLARQLGLRYMPKIEFYFDESFDYASQINELLRLVQNDDETNNTSF
ncbi:MAG: 30S ribosome-binding factor RbfA [Deltaproteobacteria bacterium]|nr:30S ribosome-binding factor RbfA [Deltaproteobacteria bacterium]